MWGKKFVEEQRAKLSDPMAKLNVLMTVLIGTLAAVGIVLLLMVATSNAH